jgi:uncharacterized BrkB/YihY/UPF0761 family membrane protein
LGIGLMIPQHQVQTHRRAQTPPACFVLASGERSYFRHFAHYNRTYGTLGGFIAMMAWLYWTSFVLPVGAELNAELAKESDEGEIPWRRELERRSNGCPAAT